MQTSEDSVNNPRHPADSSLTPELARSLLLSDHHQSSKEVKEKEKCPRCESRNTKFCYYNNYNTSQPRHFCRSCRRYWTLGGSLRNVPIGGSSRNNAHNTTNKRLRSKLNPNSSHNPNPNLDQSSPGCFLPPLEPFRIDLGLELGARPGAGPSTSIEDMGFSLGPTTLVWPSSLLVEGGGVAHHDCFNAVPAAVSGPGDGTPGPANGGELR